MSEQTTSIGEENDFRLWIPHKDAFVAALRSGEYQQGRARLYRKDINAYCCLGVYAKVAGMEISDKSDGIAVDRGDASYASYEPIEAHFGGYRNSDLLIGMNDRLGWSFAQIADFIDGKGPTIAEAKDLLAIERRI